MLRNNPPLITAVAILAACALAACGEQPKPVALPAMPAANLVAHTDAQRPSPDGAQHDGRVLPTTAQYMQPGHCIAGSRIKDEDAPGGFGPSTNYPKRVTTETALAANSVYLLAQPEVSMSFGDETMPTLNYPHMRLLLVNTTDETIAFDASDSRLSIIQQAKDADGNWQPIEYLPQSWCGNSYHQVFLPASEFWAFPVNRYEGEIKTTLRFAMLDAGQVVLTSNEFEGSVHPDQFSKPQPRSPQGIMDPYPAVE